MSTTIPGIVIGRPGSRPCCLFSVSSIIDPTDPEVDLSHHYGSITEDAVGIVVTCAAGFVDLGHVRDLMDLVKYFYDTLQVAKNWVNTTNILQGRVTLLSSIPASDRLAVAQVIALQHAVFHEIESYFCTIPGMHNSSFSPEDMPSNLIGIYLGAKAIAAEGGANFDKHATEVLKAFLIQVGQQPKAVTMRAMNALAGTWFLAGGVDPTRLVLFSSSDPNRYLQRRNFSYAFSPWLQSLSTCTGTASLPSDFLASVPALHSSYISSQYTMIPQSTASFAAFFGLSGRVPQSYLSDSDFDAAITFIQADAFQVYGPNFDSPN